jgi:hypothetical protein
MTDPEPVFEQTYRYYLGQIAELNLKDFQDVLGIHVHENEAIIDVFGEPHRISGNAITGPSNIRPTFDICIILSKYILLCPDILPQKTGWVSYRDFKDSGPLLKFYANDVERPIANRFTGKIDALKEAGTAIGGYKPDIDLSYDFAIQFDVLPRIPLLLLFNDADNEFPASCSVLFQNDAEKYLDAECLSMVGVLLNRRLKKAIKV